MTRLTDLECRIQIAALDRQIAEMRLEQMEHEKVRAEFQANWYEDAPLSWLLRKTVYAFDRAITARMTRVSEDVAVYDTHREVAIHGRVAAHDLRVLSRSYEQSVTGKTIGPTGMWAAVIRVVWFFYRVVRKALKLALRPVTSRRRGVRI